ncbi:hypothetical protein INT45_001441 [Circinella minor]|uniref:DUF6532 domain-containing protein n=1 Tax=Circinella minor TaxID=1195481 RepID=A0A8H7VFF2_9FUNG|nr:hypothetical protein INT45_001441 [Circinella minor]
MKASRKYSEGRSVTNDARIEVESCGSDEEITYDHNRQSFDSGSDQENSFPDTNESQEIEEEEEYDYEEVCGDEEYNDYMEEGNNESSLENGAAVDNRRLDNSLRSMVNLERFLRERGFDVPKGKKMNPKKTINTQDNQEMDNYCDGDDDDDTDDDDHDEQLSKIINLKGVDDPKNTFADAAAPDTYLLQAWPQGAESRTFATNVLKKIKGVVNEERRATPDMVKKYCKLVKSRRTTFHSQVKQWILNYEKWPTEEAPSSPQQKYEYLATNSRFARRNFESTGRLLQNPCLVDCMKYVCLNKNGGSSPRLTEIPNPIPKPLLVLTYVAILYRLAKLGNHDIYLNAAGREFGEGSTYQKTYDDMLDINGDVGRRIRWFEVEEMVAKELEGDNGQDGWTPSMVAGAYD